MDDIRVGKEIRFGVCVGLPGRRLSEVNCQHAEYTPACTEQFSCHCKPVVWVGSPKMMNVVYLLSSRSNRNSASSRSSNCSRWSQTCVASWSHPPSLKVDGIFYFLSEKVWNVPNCWTVDELGFNIALTIKFFFSSNKNVFQTVARSHFLSDNISVLDGRNWLLLRCTYLTVSWRKWKNAAEIWWMWSVWKRFT